MSKDDWDEWKAAEKERKDENYRKSLAVFEQAQELAHKNGFQLHRHSPHHFALIYKVRGYTKWLWNLYPSNQRIYTDPHFRGPFLELQKPWTLLDAVSAAIIQTQLPSKRIMKELEKIVQGD